MKAEHLLADIPAVLADELFTELLVGKSFRVERIVSRGHQSPPGFWYDQDEHEWVLLIAGSARLEFADEATAVALQPGDHLLIPAHTKHRVAWTDPDQDTVWLAVHYHD